MEKINKPDNLTYFQELSSFIAAKISSTYLGKIAKELKESHTVLDVGCGPGVQMYTLNKRKKMKITGVDMFEEYLNRCKKIGVYEDLIKSDVRNLLFADDTFDAVLCSHVIEHLKKEEGFHLMNNLERIAKNKVIIVTPLGFLEQDEYDGNPFQRHQSAWSADEFKKLGYQIYGQGLKFFHSDNIFARIISKFKPLCDLISILLSPIISRRPNLCYQIICTKNKKKSSYKY